MTQVRALQLVVTILVSIALVACDEWPPYEEEIRENLIENRQILEELEAVLDESGYRLIRRMGSGSVSVVYEANGEIENDYIDDEKGWGELLSKAKVRDISRNEDVFFFNISDNNDGDVYTHFQYIHHPDADSELKACLLGHREIQCGECIAKLDDEWWVYYEWFPNNLGHDDLDAWIDEEITQEEFDQRSESAIDKCWRDGYSAMGYEIPENTQQ